MNSLLVALLVGWSVGDLSGAPTVNPVKPATWAVGDLAGPPAKAHIEPAKAIAVAPTPAVFEVVKLPAHIASASKQSKPTNLNGSKSSEPGWKPLAYPSLQWLVVAERPGWELWGYVAIDGRIYAGSQPEQWRQIRTVQTQAVQVQWQYLPTEAPSCQSGSCYRR